MEEDKKNVISVVGWQPISEYDSEKYDWVLVKYILDDGFECIPRVAEKRSDGKWYDEDGDCLKYVRIKYFFDMQQLDK